MEDSPGVRFPPPFIYVAFFLIGLATRRFVPLHVPHGHIIGTVFASLAAALLVWGVATMLRARTAILPDKSATELVSSGPFQFTRNPLYISMTLGYISAACWIDVVTALLFLPIALAVLQVAVIRREEAYLERRFGDAYREYTKRVRRWL